MLHHSFCVSTCGTSLWILWISLGILLLMLLVSEMFARLLKWMLRDMETQRWIFVHILRLVNNLWYIWESLFYFIACKAVLIVSVKFQWLTQGLTEATQYEQAEHGKTELSLVQFSVSFSWFFSGNFLNVNICRYIHQQTLFLDVVVLQIRNPTWKPSEQGTQFISTIRENGSCEKNSQVSE